MIWIVQENGHKFWANTGIVSEGICASLDSAMLRGPRSDAQQTVRNVHTIQQQTETISNACRDMGPLSNMMPVPSLQTT